MIKGLIISFILLFLLVVPVSASPPGKEGPLDFSQWSGGGQSNTIIEKQSWWLDCCTPDPAHTVVNPGGIGTWDINEHNSFVVSGYLNPSASASGTYKHVWDFNPIYSCRPICANWSGTSNRFSFGVEAPSNLLLVTLCFNPQGRCFSLPPLYNVSRKVYVYSICSQVLYSNTDPAIISILGSNGGKGAPSIMTMNITNTDSRKTKGLVHNVRANWGLSSDIFNEVYCDTTQDFINNEYPFYWE